MEILLGQGQRVVWLDNSAIGRCHNLAAVQAAVGPAALAHSNFIEDVIRELADCQRACAGVDLLLHEAAPSTVPRSIADLIGINATKVGGFLNRLVAARDAGVKRFVYAASSSTYGDHPGLPKVEDTIGRPLSPSNRWRCRSA